MFECDEMVHHTTHCDRCRRADWNRMHFVGCAWFISLCDIDYNKVVRCVGTLAQVRACACVHNDASPPNNCVGAVRTNNAMRICNRVRVYSRGAHGTCLWQRVFPACMGAVRAVVYVSVCVSRALWFLYIRISFFFLAHRGVRLTCLRYRKSSQI